MTLFRSDVLPVVKEKMFTAIKRISSEELLHASNSDINRELLAVYHIHALMGLVFHWIEGGFRHPPSYMQEQLLLLIQWRPTAARPVRDQSGGRTGGRKG